MVKKLARIHPGEILLKDFLQPMGISQYRLARSTSVSPRRINEIVLGMRAVTADTALRLERFFGPRYHNDGCCYSSNCPSPRLAAALQTGSWVYV